MFAVAETFDLTGIAGAENFRTLAEGLTVKMLDGTEGKITGNPHDGAWLVIEVTECDRDPNRIGEEDVIYFLDVEGVYLPTGTAE